MSGGDTAGVYPRRMNILVEIVVDFFVELLLPSRRKRRKRTKGE